MKHLLAALLLTLGVTSANAQTPSVAKMGVTPTTTPEKLLVQDNTGAWQQVGGFFAGGSSTPLTVSTVQNNTALSGIPSTFAASVLRVGYATFGDSPPLMFSSSNLACSLNAGAGDGGSQVPSSDGKCWIAKFTGPMDFADFGGGIVTYADTPLNNWVAAMEAANTSGTLSGAITYRFQNPVFIDVAKVYGSGVRIQGAGCNATRFSYIGTSVPAFRIGAYAIDHVPLGGGVSIYGGAASGGTGYSGGGSSVYTNVPLTGGSGAGAIGTFTVTLGVVTNLAITTGGSGYFVGDTLGVNNANLGGSGSGLIALVRGDNFYTSIKGIGFSGSVDGPLVQWGRDDMLDTINGAQSDNCENNGSLGSNVEALRVNSVVTSAFFSNVADGVNQLYGYASCNIRGAGMINFFGSCSGSKIGIHITATTAQSVFGNIFHAIDSEVVGKNLVIDDSGGVAPAQNSWVNGQWGHTTCAIDASAGFRNFIINGNLGSTTDYCGSNNIGIITLGATYNKYTLNSFYDFNITPASSFVHMPDAGANSSGIQFLTNGTQTATVSEDVGGTLRTNCNVANCSTDFVKTAGSGVFSWYNGATNLVSLSNSTLAANVPFKSKVYNLTTASPPTLSSCGTAPFVTPTSSNQGGYINFGSGTVTACTVTFATAYPSIAYCTVSWNSNPGTTAIWVPNVSNTYFTVNVSASSPGQAFSYNCQGN